MGIYDRNYYREDTGGRMFAMNGYGGRSIVVILLAINIGIFILDAFTTPAGGMIGKLANFLSLQPAEMSNPLNWFKILSAAFAHAGSSHLFGNMIVLFFFGRPIESMYGPKRFLWMYLTAAILGNLVWLTVQFLTGQNHFLLGASGATTAVFLLFCIHFPHEKIRFLFFPFIGIPAWIMGAFMVGGDIFGQLGGHDGTEKGNVAFLVHLVGAAYAYAFFKTRWSFGESIPWEKIAASFQSKPKLRVHKPDPDYDDQLASEADMILKKLHEQGEGSLSSRERRILEEYSRNIKQRR